MEPDEFLKFEVGIEVAPSLSLSSFAAHKEAQMVIRILKNAEARPKIKTHDLQRQNRPKSLKQFQQVQRANGLKPMIVGKVVNLGQVGQKANIIGFGPKVQVQLFLFPLLLFILCCLTNFIYFMV
ncbi:hypothetical protein AABB24_000392 [Solanum stoloniferum]|uniref:Uncharacterized protein n=1 Tax=Solanum stoloniferum TaxID=62892 RepID=A0ABD2VG05_9SOLN